MTARERTERGLGPEIQHPRRQPPRVLMRGKREASLPEEQERRSRLLLLGIGRLLLLLLAGAEPCRAVLGVHLGQVLAIVRRHIQTLEGFG